MTQDEVFKVFASNVARLRELVIDVIATLPADRDCPCPHVLDGITLPIQLPGARLPGCVAGAAP